MNYEVESRTEKTDIVQNKNIQLNEEMEKNMELKKNSKVMFEAKDKVTKTPQTESLTCQNMEESDNHPIMQ